MYYTLKVPTDKLSEIYYRTEEQAFAYIREINTIVKIHSLDKHYANIIVADETKNLIDEWAAKISMPQDEIDTIHVENLLIPDCMIETMYRIDGAKDAVVKIKDSRYLIPVYIDGDKIFSMYDDGTPNFTKLFTKK